MFFHGRGSNNFYKTLICRQKVGRKILHTLLSNYGGNSTKVFNGNPQENRKIFDLIERSLIVGMFCFLADWSNSDVGNELEKKARKFTNNNCIISYFWTRWCWLFSSFMCVSAFFRKHVHCTSMWHPFGTHLFQMFRDEDLVTI